MNPGAWAVQMQPDSACLGVLQEEGHEAQGTRYANKMNAIDLVRKYFAVFHARDRESAEAMLSADFTFSSPLDDKIDKKAYFERCWPNGGHQSEFRLEKVFGEGDEVFVT